MLRYLTPRPPHHVERGWRLPAAGRRSDGGEVTIFAGFPQGDFKDLT